jgi:hypothetical protein
LRRRGRARRHDFTGLQPLEGRQLLSVAIEMVITSAPAASVFDAGTNTYNTSAGDAYTFDVYLTSDDPDNDTLDGYVLNFMGTDAGISLDGWLRNDDASMFPDTSGEQYGVYDDNITDDMTVSGYTFFAAGPAPRTDAQMITADEDSNVTGWYLGRLNITLSNTAGVYTLTLATSSEAVTNPTRVTQTLDPFVEVIPAFTDLNFNIVDTPTATIQQVTSPTGTVPNTLDVTFTNVDPATVDLSDFTLTRNGVTVDWADTMTAHPDFGLINTDDNNDQTWQFKGLSDVLTDGNYVLTLIDTGITNLAGVPLLAEEVSVFTIDTHVPEVSFNGSTTSNSTPNLTGTIDELTLVTMEVTITHQNDSVNFASQTFYWSNDPANDTITIDGNNWSIAGTNLTPLEGGTYDIFIKATDALGNDNDEYTLSQGEITITDTFESDNGPGSAKPLDTSRQINLSIHEVGDADWKSLVYDGTDDLLVVASVESGAPLTVKMYLYENDTLADTPTKTITSDVNGFIDELYTDVAAGTYYFEITSPDSMVYNYSFAAGNEGDLANIVSGTVFLDENFNGVYNSVDGDSTDLTVWNSGAGIEVQLFYAQNLDNPYETIFTTDGTFTFNNVVSGQYIVKIALPDGTFQTTDATTTFTVLGAQEHTETFGLRDVEVADRLLFYNHSGYDGDNVAAQAADDAAIASDKTALLPGQTATFANYSNYRMGVNGVMIDVIGLTNPAGITAADFSFVVGNDATPSSWTTNPTPLEVTVREGEGVNDSDRVTIIFADQSITNQWLQVTLLANANTGLAVDDVFYFGNAVGETGNSSGSSANADTNIFDVSGTWSHLHGYTGDVTDHYDFNRDGSVNIFDVSAVWSNLRSSTAALQLITAPQNLVLLSTPPASMAPDRAITAIEQLALALASTGSSSSLTIQPSAANNAGSPAEDQVNRVGLLLVSAN